MWKFATSFVCGIAIGIILDKIIQYLKLNQKIKYSKVLEECFGEPMYTNTLTISDISNWSKTREEQLKSGHKIVVMKAIPEQLKELGKELEIGKGLDNFLIMALVNEENKEIVESLLIKYENLDNILDEQLKKGNGSMIVEG